MILAAPGRFIITSPRNSGSYEVEYNEAGKLIGFQLVGEWPEAAHTWVLDNLILDIEQLNRVKAGFKWTVLPMHVDTSFATFWEAYGYKVGNKKRAEKLWGLLSISEQVLALRALKGYKAYLSARPNMEQSYAETWLSQRRWENEYR